MTFVTRPRALLIGCCVMVVASGCVALPDPASRGATSSASSTTAPTSTTSSSPTKEPVDSIGRLEVVGTRSELSFLVPADWWIVDRTSMPDDADDLPTDAGTVLRRWGYDPDEFVREIPDNFDAVAGGTTVDGIGSSLTVFPYDFAISDEQLTDRITEDEPSVAHLKRTTSTTPLGRATSVTYEISTHQGTVHMQELALPRGAGTTVISVGTTHPTITDDVMTGIIETMEEHEALPAPARG